MTLVREKSSYDFSLFIHDVKLVVRNGLTAGIFLVCGFSLVKLCVSKIYKFTNITPSVIKKQLIHISAVIDAVIHGVMNTRVGQFATFSEFWYGRSIAILYNVFLNFSNGVNKIKRNKLQTMVDPQKRAFLSFEIKTVKKLYAYFSFVLALK